jgi:hypothetical protein
VAQLGARFHGMEEVVGSIPTAPTKTIHSQRLIETFDTNKAFDTNRTIPLSFSSLDSARKRSLELTLRQRQSEGAEQGALKWFYRQ